MTAKKKTKIKLTVCVDKPSNTFGRENEGYFHYFHILTRASGLREYEDQYIRSTDVNGLDLDGLVLTSQGDARCDHLYGMELVYEDCGSLEEHDLARKHQTLRKLNRGMRQLQSELGAADDYVRTFLCFAKAIGASCYEIKDGSCRADADGWSQYETSEHWPIRKLVIDTLVQYGKPAVRPTETDGEGSGSGARNE